MSCEHNMFSLMFMKIPKQKRLRSQTKEVVTNVYDYSNTGIDIREWMTDNTTMNNFALLNRQENRPVV